MLELSDSFCNQSVLEYTNETYYIRNSFIFTRFILDTCSGDEYLTVQYTSSNTTVERVNAELCIFRKLTYHVPIYQITFYLDLMSINRSLTRHYDLEDTPFTVQSLQITDNIDPIGMTLNIVPNTAYLPCKLDLPASFDTTEDVTFSYLDNDMNTCGDIVSGYYLATVDRSYQVNTTHFAINLETLNPGLLFPSGIYYAEIIDTTLAPTKASTPTLPPATIEYGPKTDHVILWMVLPSLLVVGILMLFLAIPSTYARGGYARL